jgi:hypothetical protein
MHLRGASLSQLTVTKRACTLHICRRGSSSAAQRRGCLSPTAAICNLQQWLVGTDHGVSRGVGVIAS